MMIDYEKVKNEVISCLESNRIWVLSTAAGGNISSRSMSIMNQGLEIYFQTNECYVKHEQMQANRNVALCFNNISIEGTAEAIGSWKDEKNKELMELYQATHPGSFNAYGMLEGQVVYKVIPKLIKMWKYIEGKPIRQYLYVEDETAGEMDFM